MKLLRIPAGLLAFAIAIPLAFAAEEKTLSSPDGKTVVTFLLDEGKPKYAVTYHGEVIIKPSRLGMEFADHAPLVGPFAIGSEQQKKIDETWKPVWGQHAQIHNQANELSLQLLETEGEKRSLNIILRAYDDGVGIRYHLPKQDKLGEFQLTNELTTFEFSVDHKTWWVEGLYDTYERNYSESPLSRAATTGASTPVTMKTAAGTYISLHEANLTDWAGMKLKRAENGPKLSFEADLVPWFESEIKVKGKTPHFSPWRTIQLGQNPGDLIESSLILNLNEPSKIVDTSWIQPAKFMGIWWGCITGTWNWELEEDPDKHGATTERAKRYIDACVRNNIPALLIEGWCEGWEGGIPGWGNMNMLKPYPDFDIKEVTEYGKERGVALVGHHESGGNITNYENQLPEAFEFYKKYGINRIKTGYVTGDIPLYTEGLTEKGREHHHGQFNVNHHQKIIEMAAKYQIMIDAHEPIKATGISRTWPNYVAREGARGGEFNHFIGNPPSQTCTLPFTRLLGGPMDYTPGLFDGAYTSDKRFGTRSQQLALYINLWSPLQMAADFYQAYDNEPATQFIRNVPVGNWDETIVPQAAIGEFIVTARRQGKNWFIGAITNEESRILPVPLDFLAADQKYTAIIYADGDGADFESDPYPVKIEEREVDSTTTLDFALARGGGVAVEVYPAGTEFTRPSGDAGKLHEKKKYQLRAKHSDRLATVKGNSLIQLADAKKDTQHWFFADAGNGTFRLINDGKALTALGDENDAAVTMQAVDQSNAHQLWEMKHIVGTWFHIVNKPNGRLLDVAGVNYSDGGQLHLWEHAHSPNQIWSVELID